MRMALQMKCFTTWVDGWMDGWINHRKVHKLYSIQMDNCSDAKMLDKWMAKFQRPQMI